jgi:vitamin B12 transport system substrate-binding protein
MRIKYLMHALVFLWGLSSQMLVANGSDLAAPAQRIIALSPHSVELLFLLGVGDRIVATTEYADYPEQAKAIPRIGSHSSIQIERVLELDPDLIVVWESGNPAQDVQRMLELGFNVHISRTKALLDIALELESLGALVGKKEQGRALAEQFRTRFMSLSETYQNKAPVSFFYQLWQQPLRTIAAGSWINTVFKHCGAANIFDDASADYPQVSIETVLIKAPEVIVVPSHHGAEIGTDMWQAWPEIPAVKNEHILFFDGDLLHRFSYRVLDGMEQVCTAFDQIRNS